MGRLIDADALIAKLGIAYDCAVCKHNDMPFCDWKPNVVDICEAINDVQTIEPRKGKWIKISPAGIYECSECGQNVMTSDIDVYRWCHGCGAKMEEGDE